QAQHSWRQRHAAVQFEAWRREARARGVTPPAPAPEADTKGLATGTGSVANDPPTAVIHVRYSRTGAVEFLAEVSQSLRFDAREPDHLAPLLAFFRKELLKLSWSADKNSAAQIGEPGSHLRIDEASIDLLVEHVDDLNGRILGSADGKPGARLVARQELAHGRDVRQLLRTCCGGHRQWPQPAVLDVLTCGAGKHHLHLPGEQVGERIRATAIWHMSRADLRHHVEQLAGHMGDGPNSWGRKAELARISLGVGNELRN